jgi:DNA (cytosine-5)-methyltransferase 1
MKLKCLSLFSSVGLAETYFDKHGIEVCIANEVLPVRAKFHKHLYPNSEMIEGDILDHNIYNKIIKKAKLKDCNFLLATPPCQGMSTAGKKRKDDPRNRLIIPAINAIKELSPKFAIIENVTEQLQTQILVDGEWIYILDFIRKELASDYYINDNPIVNAMNYGVAQSRERCVFLLSRRDNGFKWEFPKPNCEIVTLEDAIGHLPSLDPEVTDISTEKMMELFPDYETKKKKGLSISKWHYPPRHKLRHVEAMIHTPEGNSAWQNKIYYPKLKDGSKSKGYKNTYKRQWWNKPAYTITKYTSRLGSQENGHPGRLISDDGTESGRYWSDPRVMSIYELMIVSSLPHNWNIPEWASSNLIREAIGEGVPPKLIEAALIELKHKIEGN